MRIHIISLILVLCSCGSSSGDKTVTTVKDTTATMKDTTQVSPLPETKEIPKITEGEIAVNLSLKNSGLNWMVMNDSKATWMKDAFEYFIVPKRKQYPDYPYICYGDFNGDSRPDTAAFVTDSLKKNFRIALLVSSQEPQLWEEDILDDAAISTIGKTTIDGMDGEKVKKIKLPGDAVNVEYFEKASFVLYWNKSGFKRIQTGD